MATRAPVYVTAGPRYSLREIATMWFIYNSQAYCVQAAPDLIIRKAVKDRLYSDMVKEVAQKSRLDMLSRWYVLCEAEGLRLYRTREEAESVVS